MRGWCRVFAEAFRYLRQTGTARVRGGKLAEADARLMGFRGGSAFAALVLGFGENGGPVSGPMVARFLTES